MSHWCAFWARWNPAGVALVHAGRPYRWAWLESEVAAMAGRLRAVGIGLGDRVGILAHNRPEFVVALIAVARLGAVLVPFNPRLTHPEVREAAALVEPTLVLTEPSFRHVVAGVVDEAATIDLDDPEPFGPGPVTPVGVDDGPDLAPDDAVLICFTSGTTGRPKGAVLTHGNAAAVAEATAIVTGLTQADVSLVPAPLAFAGSSGAVAIPLLRCGGTLVLDQGADPEFLLWQVERLRVTQLGVVPVIYERMAAHPAFGSADLSSLRVARCGGSSVSPSLVEAWRSRGVPLVTSYGLTEATGFAIQMPPARMDDKHGLTGLPITGLACRVVADDGRVAEPGTPGELQLRGRTVMRGYWQDPGETRAALTEDGWLRTGDLAVSDDEGFVGIVDRIKDMLISGGINVYPAEIERVLAGTPGVRELAVVAEPHRRWGEVPVAVVVASDRPLAERGLVETARARLADFKRPRRIVFVDELPRNSTGKIMKADLRAVVTKGRDLDA
ncbi:class I adenylate-forming enzyme family protein [Pseudonocardia pini]|uniref:class I adenylate-forming enzyme family protein n=1 Tax=Pseudonocardia pini TaxID=2758030 RepID=UPI0015F0546B|nr:AMP-binding protein [Pseudonocardia pini]